MKKRFITYKTKLVYEFQCFCGEKWIIHDFRMKEICCPICGNRSLPSRDIVSFDDNNYIFSEYTKKTQNFLFLNGIKSINDITNKTRKEFLDMDYSSPSIVNEIIDVIHIHGIETKAGYI